MAEGFETRYDFWRVWVRMHDFQGMTFPAGHIQTPSPASMEVIAALNRRPERHYLAWVIVFEKET